MVYFIRFNFAIESHMDNWGGARRQTQSYQLLPAIACDLQATGCGNIAIKMAGPVTITFKWLLKNAGLDTWYSASTYSSS